MAFRGQVLFGAVALLLLVYTEALSMPGGGFCPINVYTTTCQYDSYINCRNSGNCSFDYTCCPIGCRQFCINPNTENPCEYLDCDDDEMCMVDWGSCNSNPCRPEARCRPSVCEGRREPGKTSYGEQIYCGTGYYDEDCPDGYECEEGDDYAVCCPTDDDDDGLNTGIIVAIVIISIVFLACIICVIVCCCCCRNNECMNDCMNDVCCCFICCIPRRRPGRGRHNDGCDDDCGCDEDCGCDDEGCMSMGCCDDGRRPRRPRHSHRRTTVQVIKTPQAPGVCNNIKCPCHVNPSVPYVHTQQNTANIILS